MAKVSVGDPRGARWTVYRRWGFRYWHATDARSGSGSDEFDFVVDAVQIVVISPLWLLAKCCGVPWTIVIERNGAEVGQERVRGWRRSGRRIREIVESARAGTLERDVVAGLPSAADLPPGMAVTPDAWAKLTPEAKVTLWRMYREGQLPRN
jgi:hypothetical protein